MISLSIFNAVRSVTAPARPAQPANDKDRGPIAAERKSA
jgi:hypothetical protein